METQRIVIMNLVFLLILTLSIQLVSSGSWTYENTTAWSPLCNNGKRQSPIDFDQEASSSKLNKDMTIEYTKFDKEIGMELTNTGYSVKCTFIGAEDVFTTFSGEKFNPHHFHLHWGPDENSGSEHTLNGTAFPGELHLVHWNSKYANLGDALEKPDGLLVIGAFIEARSASGHLADVVEKLALLTFKGDDGNYTANVSAGDILPANKDKFWHYNGSLTTPGCFQTVTWIVLKEKLQLTKDVFAKLRQLSTGVNNTYPNITSNYREVQSLNDRRVHYNWYTGSGVAFHGSVFLVATMQILAFIY